MKRYGHRNMAMGLLVVMALLAISCASGGTNYYSAPAPVYGYYGGYGAGYYHSDIIVTTPPPSQPPSASRPPQPSQLPARSLPRPAPRRR